MKTTQTRLASLLSLLLATAGLVGCSTHGSGTSGSETRSVGSFHAIEVHGALTLEATAGKGPSVSLTGDDNLLSLVETEVVGGRLVVRSKESISTTMPLVVHVETKDLDEVAVHGASKATVEDVDADELEVDVSGASEVTVEGECKVLDAKVSGASRLTARKLKAERVELDASGASHAELGEPSEIEAHLSGASEGRYSGSPTIDKDLSGASRLDAR
ncbi:MAG: head GIN domain-containing protein [Polyangiaceae bacterium]